MKFIWGITLLSLINILSFNVRKKTTLFRCEALLFLKSQKITA